MSALHDAVEEYLAVRRALGYQIPRAAAELRGFAAFLESNGADCVIIPLALRWAQQSRSAQPATWAERLRVVRRFAAWRSLTDPRTQVPSPGLLSHRRRRKPPYIYSDSDIERVLAQAARLSLEHGLRGATFITLFGLLAASGLRLGEALALDVPDVDLENGIVAIHNGKFGKSRFVPLHESMTVVAAIGDLTRFARPREFMSFPGLAPSKYSGDSNRTHGRSPRPATATQRAC